MSRYSHLRRCLSDAVIVFVLAAGPLASAIWATAGQPSAAQASEKAAVRKAVRQHNNSPLLKIEEVAIVSPYALVDWVAGDGGGEILLEKQSAGWKVLEDTGGSMDVDELKQHGVPQAVAEQLLIKLAKLEANERN